MKVYQARIFDDQYNKIVEITDNSKTYKQAMKRIKQIYIDNYFDASFDSLYEVNKEFSKKNKKLNYRLELMGLIITVRSKNEVKK